MINVSEGRDERLVQRIAGLPARDSAILDIHSDPDHNRSVFTIIGTDCPRDVTRRAVESLDMAHHSGVHPRIGVVDVVPFIALDGSTDDDALHARNEFARWASNDLQLPVFLYGPERTLPDIRKGAWSTLRPDLGPDAPHPTAGAVCVGVRPVLIAYNVFLSSNDIPLAKAIAARVRRPGLRTLAFSVGGHAQVSMNIVDADHISVADAYDSVAEEARNAKTEVLRAELVGLLPRRCLDKVDGSRWGQLDIGPAATIESRLR